jgi:hypothetical protein
MRRSCRWVVLLLIFYPVICDARPGPGGYMIVGPGAVSCANWTKLRRDVVLSTPIVTWVQGFLTSYNLYGPGSHDVTHGKNPDGIPGWIDNYCAQNPLNNIADAAEKLVSTLSARGAAP